MFLRSKQSKCLNTGSFYDTGHPTWTTNDERLSYSRSKTWTVNVQIHQDEINVLLLLMSLINEYVTPQGFLVVNHGFIILE